MAIMGLGEMLVGDLSLSQEQKYLVNTIYTASQHLLRYVLLREGDCLRLCLEKGSWLLVLLY